MSLWVGYVTGRGEQLAAAATPSSDVATLQNEIRPALSSGALLLRIQNRKHCIRFSGCFNESNNLSLFVGDP
jgi:hypothetical protein